MVAAGSLLGTLLSEPMSYPVGKVNLLDVYPMDFEEFLGAVNPSLLKYLEETRHKKSSRFNIQNL